VAAPVLAPMPDGLILGSGYTLRVTALDAATGNLVANVNVGLEVITGTPNEAGSFPGAPNPLLLGLSV
jgi:hypothetical protein